MTQPPNIRDSKRPEPSMEDILASIRRIVADDENSVDAVSAEPQPTTSAPLKTLSGAPPVAATPAAAASRMAKEPADKQETSVAQADVDIDAMLAALETVDMDVTEAAPQPHAENDTKEFGSQDWNQPDEALQGDAALQAAEAVQNESEPESASSDDELAAQSAELERDILELTEEMTKHGQSSEPDAAPVNIQEHVLAHRDTPRPALGGIDAEALVQPILSQSAASAVEAAFSSLASTVLSDNARPLEDLVREMLRPMLKSWLDDNLPGIVERAVRAEIERVARGR